MLQALVRRAAILVIILALVASVQIRVIPMAMGSSAADMAGMASENGVGACKGCLPGKMTVPDCGALCATMVAVIDVAPSFLCNTALSAWPWSSDPTRSHRCAPATAPPRP
jgi:hypothetical protein